MNNQYQWASGNHPMVTVLLLLMLLICTPVMVIRPAFAGQCFSDPKAAYAYLLKQENNTKIVTATIKSSRKVNINTATEAELASLTGIGSKKAQAIILYRDGFGRFDSVDGLTKVKGIGDKTVEKNRSRLTVR